MSRVLPVTGVGSNPIPNVILISAVGQLNQLTFIGDEQNGMVITDLCLQFLNATSVTPGSLVQVGGYIFGSPDGATGITPLQSFDILLLAGGTTPLTNPLVPLGYSPIVRSFGSGLVLGKGDQIWMKCLVYTNSSGTNLILDLSGYVF